MTIVTAVLLVAYPMLVYMALTRLDPRSAGLVLAVVFVPLAIARLRRMTPAQRRSLAIVPVLVAVCIIAAVVVDQAGFLLLSPVVINSTLLVAFAVTLRRGSMPMIERFARLQEPDLRPAELAWCRAWTWIWCGAFVVNAVTAGILGWLDHRVGWALYNGLLAYLLMGVLLTSEYVARKWRFGRLSTRWPDRWLAKLLPAGRRV